MRHRAAAGEHAAREEGEGVRRIRDRGGQSNPLVSSTAGVSKRLLLLPLLLTLPTARIKQLDAARLQCRCEKCVAAAAARVDANAERSDHFPDRRRRRHKASLPSEYMRTARSVAWPTSPSPQFRRGCAVRSPGRPRCNDVIPSKPSLMRTRHAAVGHGWRCTAWQQ